MKEQVQTNPAAGSEMTAKKTQHQKIVAMVQIALFAAIIAVCSWIQIPMTVPFTMQTFAVFCALATLGGKGGTISVLIYIVLGAVGVPVFAGFTGGVASCSARPAAISSAFCSPDCSTGSSPTSWATSCRS